MLRPITYRKSIALTLDYNNDAVFNICDCELKQIEKDINAKIYMSTRCDHSQVVGNIYDVAVIRFNETKTKQPILALKIIELLIRLNFRYDGQVTDRALLTDRVLLTNIEVQHHNRQFDQVYFEFLEIG